LIATMYGAIPTTATRPLAAAFWAGKVNRRGSDDEIGEDRVWQPSHHRLRERLPKCLDAQKQIPSFTATSSCGSPGTAPTSSTFHRPKQAEINARTEERI
jgi:hypothetical protein